MREAWILGDRSAVLQTDLLRGAIDLARPDRGLTGLFFDDQQLDPSIELLAADLSRPGEPPPALIDAYVRGGDLVASYGSSERRPIAVQIYWRAHNDSAARTASVDLEVSVQTQLLDSDPTVTAHSRLPSKNWAESRSATCPPSPASLWFAQLGDADCTYAEMIHPSEACESEVVAPSNEPMWSLQHRLFANRLEKGVILRARIRGFFLERAGDIERLDVEHQRFLDSPPPLTT